MRRQSLKAARFARELKRVVPKLTERAGYVCELSHLEGCDGPLVPHHRLMRSQGGGNGLENLLLVCDAHHRLIHHMPTLSYKEGWLIRCS